MTYYLLFCLSKKGNQVWKWCYFWRWQEWIFKNLKAFSQSAWNIWYITITIIFHFNFNLWNKPRFKYCNSAELKIAQECRLSSGCAQCPAIGVAVMCPRVQCKFKFVRVFSKTVVSENTLVLIAKNGSSPDRCPLPLAFNIMRLV